jgi:hypothetical protein
MIYDPAPTLVGEKYPPATPDPDQTPPFLLAPVRRKSGEFEQVEIFGPASIELGLVTFACLMSVSVHMPLE